MNAPPTLNEKISSELRKMLEHVSGELLQRVDDLRLKANQPWGGALSGRGPASSWAAEVLAEASAVIEAALAEVPLPKAQQVQPTAKGTEAPLHPRHPSKASGKPPARG